MTTLGQQILDRLAVVEKSITEIQLALPEGIDQPTGMGDLRRDIEALKKKLEETPSSLGSTADRRPFWNPKDCMPEILSSDYKGRWRTWSYKARDWLAQLDISLGPKLEKVESMSTELSPEYIASLDINERTDSEIRRFLVHRLDGDPA